MKRIILGFMIFSFLLVPTVSSKSSELFIDHVTDMIYQDCQGKDIQLNHSYIINTQTNQPINLLEWPYGYQNLRRIIELFGEMEPLAFLAGTCEDKGVHISGRDGCGILTCENNKLDINQFTYFWNGIRISVPPEEFKTTYGANSPIIETHGDESPVTTGDNSSIIQHEENIWIQLFWSKGTVGGILITVLITGLSRIVYDFLTKKFLNKKKRRKSSK